VLEGRRVEGRRVEGKRVEGSSDGERKVINETSKLEKINIKFSFLLFFI
jgi:hypothetical protein